MADTPGPQGDQPQSVPAIQAGSLGDVPEQREGTTKDIWKIRLRCSLRIAAATLIRSYASLSTTITSNAHPTVMFSSCRHVIVRSVRDILRRRVIPRADIVLVFEVSLPASWLRFKWCPCK